MLQAFSVVYGQFSKQYWLCYKWLCCRELMNGNDVEDHVYCFILEERSGDDNI